MKNKVKTKSLLAFIFFIILLVPTLSGCDAKKIDSLSKTNDCVYIYEEFSHGEVPYDIVSNDYDGKVLLVRHEDFVAPTNVGSLFSFYEDSDIDKYLNGDFLNTLGDLSKNIQETTITITKQESLGISKTETKEISRKIFLLSMSEIGYSNGNKDIVGVVPDEGKKINAEQNAKLQNYRGWTRTPNTLSSTETYFIDKNGKPISVETTNKMAFRPAFCLEKGTKINKVNDKYYIEK